MTSVVVLGSTGSVGTQALDVIRRHRDRFRVVGLSAHSKKAELAAQAAEFEVTDSVLTGAVLDAGKALERLASLPGADIVVNAVVGAVGLRATLAALRSGKRLALANKESLITGGELVESARDAGGGELIPVDSEHSAIYQCLRAGRPSEVDEVILTASGGPFRGCSRAELSAVKPRDALRHPTWEMGPKITVDSATLMNKGLEVVEAHFLFGLSYDQVRVVVHPESIVHGLVRFCDGAVVAQLQEPTMEAPIAFALTAPDRLADPMGVLDWGELQVLTFERPDENVFPCLGLAYEAGRRGGLAPAVLNAANEEAVSAFLEGRLTFLSISEVNAKVMEETPIATDISLEAVEETASWARRRAREVVLACQ
jgi:1-deoxy-D-xylulose-5-phosphate reductoisomerase